MHAETLRALVSLYHGEVAAVKAYERAIRKFSGQIEESELEQLALRHEQAVDRLSREILTGGQVLPEAVNAWVTLADQIEAVAVFLDDDVALHVLQKGEQIGLHAYERALAGSQLPIGVTRVLGDLMVETFSHLTRLRRLRDHVHEVQDRPLW